MTISTTAATASSTKLTTIHLQQVCNFAQLLRKESKDYEQLLHNIVDTVCGIGPGIRLSELIEEQQMKQQDEPKLSLMEIQSILDAIKMFIQHVMSRELSMEQISQELKNLALNSNDLVQLFVRVIEGRRNDLVKTMKKLTVSELSQAYLHDFDWKLHLVIASDKCSSIREPVLLLNLRVKKQNINRDILVELTRDDLDKILKDFDKIQTVLKTLTA